MSQLTTYTVKSKLNGFIWLFKYHLNGSLFSFEILDGELALNQVTWLFLQGNFPFDERIMINVWIPKLKANFEIVKADPVLDFEALWKMYGRKEKRELSEKAFNKLSTADKIKCFMALKAYARHLQKSGEARAHLVTWINQKRYDDEY